MIINFHDEAFLSGDRTCAYEWLRAEQPVWRMPENWGPDTWVVSRYADVQAVLRLPETRVQVPGTDAPPWIKPGPTRTRLTQSLAQADAPNHTRLKKVLAPLFMPRRLEVLREISTDSVNRALAAIDDLNEPFDAVGKFAAHVPKGVLCSILGIPETDWPMLMAGQHDYLGIFSLFPLSAEQSTGLDRAVLFYRDYFSNLLEKADPTKDSTLVQTLRAAELAGELQRDEVVALMHTVMDAGADTTRTSISNAIELLATVPGMLDTLRAEPELVTNAVEEILRVRTPVHVRHRFLSEVFTCADGSQIPAGALVLILLSSANQDESVFEDAQRVDLRRANAGRHQAFGGGLHHCLGAPLARIQLQETLRGIIRTYERIELVDGPGKRYASLKFPALSSLQIVAEKARSSVPVAA